MHFSWVEFSLGEVKETDRIIETMKHSLHKEVTLIIRVLPLGQPPPPLLFSIPPRHLAPYLSLPLPLLSPSLFHWPVLPCRPPRSSTVSFFLPSWPRAGLHNHNKKMTPIQKLKILPLFRSIWRGGSRPVFRCSYLAEQIHHHHYHHDCLLRASPPVLKILGACPNTEK